MSDRCPHCSFQPTTNSDFCDKHRNPKSREELEAELAKAQAEVKHLKSILRRGHDELEIRMSHNDNHYLKVITDQELRNLEWPIERIQKEAGLMYQKLKHYESRKPK